MFLLAPALTESLSASFVDEVDSQLSGVYIVSWVNRRTATAYTSG
jgi:hypothetical protein